MWWKLPPGEDRNRARAAADIGELTLVAEGRITEFKNASRHFYQGPSGWLHPFFPDDEPGRRIAFLAAGTNLRPKPSRYLVRRYAGRLALKDAKSCHVEFLPTETPTGYRIAFGKIIVPRPSKSTLAKIGREETV